MDYDYVDTQLGRILIAADEQGLRYLLFEDGPLWLLPQPQWRKSPAALREVRSQLLEYLAGKRTTFDLRLAPRGTAFQQRVWRRLLKIPYGATTSYGRLAGALGSPQAARAVGAANGRNPISIVIPCHRVIGENGRLTGYGGGLAAKEALLELERPPS